VLTRSIFIFFHDGILVHFVIRSTSCVGTRICTPTSALAISTLAVASARRMGWVFEVASGPAFIGCGSGIAESDSGDALSTGVVDKERQGCKKLISAVRPLEMEELMRSKLRRSHCRAGQHRIIARTDGSVVLRVLQHDASGDRSTTKNHRFDHDQLREVRWEGKPHCLLTMNHVGGNCHNDVRLIKSPLTQVANRRQGVANFG
jgi:hypothetical protein